jgi:transcription initiation factor IIE alpha subunit
MVVDYTHRTRPSGSVFATENLPMNHPADTTLDTKSLAVHVVVTMSDAQAEGRVLRLDELAADLGVRKADVRHVITRLHAEGHVDALRLRLTMSGLALATSLGTSALPELRRHEERIVRVA